MALLRSRVFSGWLIFSLASVTLATLATSEEQRDIAAMPRRSALPAAGEQARAREAFQPQSVQAGPGSEAGKLSIRYPLDGTVFPPEIVPPNVRWTDASGADTWSVQLAFGKGDSEFLAQVIEPAWTPEAAQWEKIKQRSLEANATLTILGQRRPDTEVVLSRAQVAFRTSKDAVGAPIFYREVILPFIEAVKDPSRIRWRLGSVGAIEQPVVMEGLPVCGNCHSFSSQGDLLAMDVDYANSKGSYVIAPVSSQMALRPRDIITWDDYRREDGEQTFGLLSQISPDGQTVVSTVKDRSVFVPKPDLEFSQLFFPIQGILATYDRRTRTFQALPGADDPAYVQSNPTWSPDGKHIVFARAKAYELRVSPAKGRALLTPEECDEFLKEGKPFRFDLYRIPFNHGRGGTPEPLEGASGDGFSNYFARYSPDGRWIVFCKARNYMLLQPDSALYIVPAAGGPARRLACNMPRMNSWHSWSPNGHWLVFSSKANGPYTQLFLTHLDAEGHSSPAVELAHFTAPDRAANIPEFVRMPPDGIVKIEADFLNDYSYARAGFVCEQAGDFDGAVRQYTEALRLNPDNAHAHERLGAVFCQVKRDFRRGLPHCREAVRLNPNCGQARFVLGLALFNQGDAGGAIEQLTASLDGFADATDPAYTPVAVQSLLGSAFLLRGQSNAAVQHFQEAVRLNGKLAEVRFYLAVALAREGQISEAFEQHRRACSLKSALERWPEFYDQVSLNLAKAGRFKEAAQSARRALLSARAIGNDNLAREMEKRIERYERQ